MALHQLPLGPDKRTRIVWFRSDDECIGAADEAGLVNHNIQLDSCVVCTPSVFLCLRANLFFVLTSL